MITIYNTAPYFTWTKALDIDAIDTSLRYELQVATDVDFNNIIVIRDDIYDSPFGETVTYQLKTTTEALPEIGQYFWRVRASDDKQYGAWGRVHDFYLDETNNDMPAKITISEYWFYVLNARIHIVYPDGKYLGATLNIIQDRLKAKINVLQNSNSDVNAKVTIVTPSEVDLNTQINVIKTGVDDLNAMLNIIQDRLQVQINVDAENQKVPGKIFIVGENDKVLPSQLNIIQDRIKAKINVIKYGSQTLEAKINVQYESQNEVYAKVFVRGKNDIDATIFVIQNKYEDIDAQINVAATRPTDVDLFAYNSIGIPIPEAIWQEEQEIHFVWNLSTDPYYEIDYYGQWNNDPNYEITENDINFGNNLSAVRYCYTPESWYFHVRPLNSIGNWSLNTTTFNVWYNHKPTQPLSPFYVNELQPGISCIIYETTPIIQWNNASDPDASDIIEYELQIATDINFNNIVNEYFNIPKADGLFTEYYIPRANAITNDGKYFFRVRTFDNKEYSDYSFGGEFSLERWDVDCPAKINVPISSYNFTQAKISVNPYKNLNSQIIVYNGEEEEINAQINIVSYYDVELKSQIFVRSLENLFAKIEILPYSNLNSIIRVIQNLDVNVNAQILIMKDAEQSVPAQIFLGTKESVDVQAQITITGKKDLPAKLYVWSQGHLPNWGNLNAQIRIVYDSYKPLLAKIDVKENAPGNVVLFSNVPEDVWQEENNIHFYWLPTESERYAIKGYYIALDRYPDTLVGASNRTINDLETFIDLEDVGGSGHYYFHIAAYNTINRIGATTHFSLKYNHLPPQPNLPMLVNGLDTVGQTPIVGSTVIQSFYWGGAIDPDPLDLLTYDIIISDSDNFENIIFQQNNISGTTLTLNYEDLLKKGIYYWRVRCYDGHQSGDWGTIGSFTINTPPPKPQNLFVLQ